MGSCHTVRTSWVWACTKHVGLSACLGQLSAHGIQCQVRARIVRVPGNMGLGMILPATSAWRFGWSRWRLERSKERWNVGLGAPNWELRPDQPEGRPGSGGFGLGTPRGGGPAWARRGPAGSGGLRPSGGLLGGEGGPDGAQPGTLGFGPAGGARWSGPGRDRKSVV